MTNSVQDRTGELKSLVASVSELVSTENMSINCSIVHIISVCNTIHYSTAVEVTESPVASGSEFVCIGLLIAYTWHRHHQNHPYLYIRQFRKTTGFPLAKNYGLFKLECSEQSFSIMPKWCPLYTNGQKGHK